MTKEDAQGVRLVMAHMEKIAGSLKRWAELAVIHPHYREQCKAEVKRQYALFAVASKSLEKLVNVCANTPQVRGPLKTRWDLNCPS